MPTKSSAASAQRAFMNQGVFRVGMSGAGMRISSYRRSALPDLLEIIGTSISLRVDAAEGAIGVPDEVVPRWFEACIRDPRS